MVKGIMPTLTLLTMVISGILISCSYFDNTRSAKNAAKSLGNNLEMPADLPLKVKYQLAEVSFIEVATADKEVIQERVNAANDFHFAVAKHLAADEPNANFVFSPFSVQTAFALAYPATSADLEGGAEMARVLGFDLNPETFHPAMHGYLLSVKDAFKDPPEGSQLKYALVNQVWTAEQYGLQSNYMDTIKRYYNAGIASLPFADDPEGSRQTINKFIEHNTNGLIKDLLGEGGVSPDIASVLTNSVYMLADWEVPFKKESTHPESFHGADGSSSEVPMMTNANYFDYFEGENYQIINLDYVGQKIAMAFVLPRDGVATTDFEPTMNASLFAEMLARLELEMVQVSLPKFTIEWGSHSITGALKKLGMQKIFASDQSHFPHILTLNNQPVSDGIYISDVVHKAKIIVDEKGTEAAAATAIMFETTSAPADEPKIFKADRPFLFFIYEKKYGAILFAGRMTQP